MMITLSRLYADPAAAENAVRELQAAGLPDDDIGIIASTRSVRLRNADLRNGDDTDGEDERAQARMGAGVGAMLGGAAGLLAGMGLLALPGIGPVVAAGWLASAITGAVSGGAAGGVIGALVEAGVSENDAGQFLEAIRRGGTLVTIRIAAQDRALYKEILDSAASDGGAVPAATGGPVPLPLPDPEPGPG